MDKIRQKIKELRELLDGHNYYLDNSEQALGYGAALDDIEEFLDTLSEEPDKSLEEAAEDAVCMAFGGDPAYYGNKAEFSVNECMRLFIAGAEWQKSQMISALKNDGELPIEFIDKFHEIDHNAFQNGQKNMKEQMLKDAVEGTVHANTTARWVEADVLREDGFICGDKVRILVHKAEEE